MRGVTHEKAPKKRKNDGTAKVLRQGDRRPKDACRDLHSILPSSFLTSSLASASSNPRFPELPPCVLQRTVTDENSLGSFDSDCFDLHILNQKMLVVAKRTEAW